MRRRRGEGHGRRQVFDAHVVDVEVLVGAAPAGADFEQQTHGLSLVAGKVHLRAAPRPGGVPVAPLAEERAAPGRAAVGGGVDVEAAAPVGVAGHPEGELRVLRRGEVDLAVQQQLLVAAVPEVAVGAAADAGRAAVDRVGGDRPAARLPVSEAGFERLGEREGEGRPALGLADRHVVDPPAGVGRAAVGGDAEADPQIRLAAPAGEVDPLSRPGGADAGDDVRSGPVRAVHADLDAAEVGVLLEGGQVPEAQERVDRRGQVHRGEDVGAAAVRVVARRRAGDAASGRAVAARRERAPRRLVGAVGPADPVPQVVHRVGDRIRERHRRGGALVARGDRAVRVEGEDLVVVGRADGEPFRRVVVEGAHRVHVGDQGDERPVERHVGRRRTTDFVAGEVRVARLGPGEFGGLEARRRRGEGHRRREVFHAHVVDVEVLVGASPAGGDLEHQAGLLSLVGGEVHLRAAPRPGGVPVVPLAEERAAPGRAAVGGGVDVEAAAPVGVAGHPERELRVRRPGEVELAVQDEPLEAVAPEIAVGAAAGARRAAVRRVGGDRPAAGLPGAEAGLEGLGERQRDRRQRRDVLHFDVVDVPAVGDGSAVGGDAETDPQVRLAAPRREVDHLARPVEARPGGDVRPGPVRAVHADLDGGEVGVLLQGEAVPKRQRGVEGAAQIDGRLRVGVRAVGVVAGAVLQDEGPAVRRDDAGLRPAAGEGPGVERPFEAVRERQRVVERRRRGFGRAVRAEAAPAVHGVDPVVVGRVEREAAVVEGRRGDVVDLGGDRAVDPGVGGGRADDFVVVEAASRRLRPRDPDGVRVERRRRRRRQRGERLGDGDVVEMPAVAVRRPVGRDAEPHQRRLRLVGREVHLHVRPGGDGPVGEVAQRGPGLPVVGRDLDEAVVVAGEVVDVPEGEGRTRRGAQVERRGERQRRVDVRGVGAARRIAPRRSAAVRGLGRKGPRHVGAPGRRPRLAVVEEREVHPRRRRRRDFVGGRLDPVAAGDDDPVVVAALRVEGDVGEVRRGRRAEGGDRRRRPPIEALRRGADDAVAGEVGGGRGRPGEGDRVGGDGAGGRRRRVRRLVDHHVVHVPAVERHVGVADEAEAELHRRLRLVGREVDLLAPPGRVAGERGERGGLPTRAAVERDLDVAEVVPRLEVERVPERQARPRRPRQVERVPHRQRDVRVVGVVGAGAVAEGEAPRVRALRARRPRRRGGPLTRAPFRAVRERIGGQREARGGGEDNRQTHDKTNGAFGHRSSQGRCESAGGPQNRRLPARTVSLKGGQLTSGLY